MRQIWRQHWPDPHLLVGEIEEVVGLVNQEDFKGSTGHVVPPGVDLTQLGEWELEVCDVP